MFLLNLAGGDPLQPGATDPYLLSVLMLYEHDNLLPRLRSTFASEAHPARARLQCQGEMLVPLSFMRLQSVKRHCADFTRDKEGPAKQSPITTRRAPPLPAVFSAEA